MTRLALALGASVGLAACGGIGGSDDPDPAGGADAGSQTDGGDRPARPDARCVSDEFEGPLAPEWQLLAGVAPTLSFQHSAVRIDDAFPTVSASLPPNAWIYEPDVDRGNQLGWQIPIGVDDFTLEFDMTWASALGEFTLAGFGLVNPSVQLELQAGVHDGLGDSHGGAYVRIREDGTDLVYNGPPAEPGGGLFRIERAAGALRVEIDGSEVLAGPLDADIAHLVLFAVGHSNGTTAFPFGQVDIGHVETCVFDD